MEIWEIIYLVETIDSGGQEYLKIGRTNVDASARVRTLQTGCPLPLNLKRLYRIPSRFFGYRKGTSVSKIEKILHRELVAFRSGGEWFKMNDLAWGILNKALLSIDNYLVSDKDEDVKRKIQDLIQERL